MIERIREILTACMVIGVFVFFFGLLLGAGRLNTINWPGVFLIYEVGLGIVIILLETIKG
jgi:hypothetical protein